MAIFISANYDIVDVRCNPLCLDGSDYGPYGSCQSQCGTGGYCCREDGDQNRCPQEIMEKAVFPSDDEHYCLTPKETCKIY